MLATWVVRRAVARPPNAKAGASLLLVLLAGAACTSRRAEVRPAEFPPGDAAAARAEALFARHCAACHALDGSARTEFAGLMDPRPRAFSDGVFKLASTENGVPTDRDLVQSIRRGMPGSAMPGYEWLPEQDLEALARHVRSLAVAGAERMLAARAIENGEPVDRAHLHASALARLRPGPPVAIPVRMAPDEALLLRGQQLWLQYCAACHGRDGRGRAPADGWAGTGEFPWARDFTAGFLRAEPSHEQLACRIRAGMPGAQMPPTTLPEPEAAALIAWVQSLIPEQAAGHHAQWRRRLRAARCATLPGGPDDQAWQGIDTVRLPLAPLLWRGDAVFEVFLRSAHDGRRFCVELRWPDRTRDDRLGGNVRQGDGAALQFTASTDPPMFAMGGSEPVDIWHWKAFRSGDLAGVFDLLGPQVHPVDAGAVIPGLFGPSRRSETVTVRSPEEMAQQRGRGLQTPVVPVWRDGFWTLTMCRDLAPRIAGEIELRPGVPVLFAVAIWDGAIDPHAGSKSVSTWHSLELDR
jgi:DMSO reductase family type II enzyme heme b subunit